MFIYSCWLVLFAGLPILVIICHVNSKNIVVAVDIAYITIIDKLHSLLLSLITQPP